MSVLLTSGGNTSITEHRPGLHRLRVGLGWKFPDDREPFDLDASALLVQANGQVRGDGDFIFYNHPADAAGSVRYGGDSLDGAGEGDDEVITIDLERVPAEIAKVIVCVTIHEAAGHHFGHVGDAYIRLQNLDDGEEIVRFDLDQNFTGMTAMLFGEVYRHNGTWKFRALGMGFEGGLRTLISSFGVAVQ
ncbi:TerD family protein [Deinococcus seoulensis]|uniref:TerD family protein n=1 Tax=Deinococcus seoulensis TaxID=1837379 RepID=UPI0016690714|nr:TerD family protein [Deinococcus seoulensis]